MDEEKRNNFLFEYFQLIIESTQFHFFLLKFGYVNKTENPNASPLMTKFGLFLYGAGKPRLRIAAVAPRGLARLRAGSSWL